jgi:hypothetical protein
VSSCSPVNTAYHFRRPESSLTTLWESKILQRYLYSDYSLLMISSVAQFYCAAGIEKNINKTDVRIEQYWGAFLVKLVLSVECIFRLCMTLPFRYHMLQPDLRTLLQATFKAECIHQIYNFSRETFSIIPLSADGYVLLRIKNISDKVFIFSYARSHNVPYYTGVNFFKPQYVLT